MHGRLIVCLQALPDTLSPISLDASHRGLGPARDLREVSLFVYYFLH